MRCHQHGARPLKAVCVPGCSGIPVDAHAWEEKGAKRALAPSPPLLPVSESTRQQPRGQGCYHFVRNCSILQVCQMMWTSLLMGLDAAEGVVERRGLYYGRGVT